MDATRLPIDAYVKLVDATYLENVGVAAELDALHLAAFPHGNIHAPGSDDQTTITGNAGSATVLQTARAINGVDFDGSAPITINAVDTTARIATSAIDASNGVAGLTLLKINFKNALNTVTSFFTNANTLARTYIFPDKDGTVALMSDITGTNSGTNTGDQDLTGKENAGVAAGLVTSHENSHPAPTLRDTRNQIAGSYLTAETDPVFAASEASSFATGDKLKLDGIAVGANNYTHPANHPSSVITQTAEARFVSDAEKSLWNNKANSSDIASQSFINALIFG